MPRFEIKIASRPNIDVPVFSAAQMDEIGNKAIRVMEERVATGTDVFDQPAPPLTPKYAKRKAAKGLNPIRDIHFTGITLGAIHVTEADTHHVHVAIQGSVPYRKALFNQNRDPWFGISTHDDMRLIAEEIEPIFHRNIAEAVGK